MTQNPRNCGEGDNYILFEFLILIQMQDPLLFIWQPVDEDFFHQLGSRVDK